MQNNVSIYTGVVCEDDVFIGPSVVFTNIVSNPRSAINGRDQYIATRVEQEQVSALTQPLSCGNTIGQYAFIGAGARRYQRCFSICSDGRQPRPTSRLDK